MLKNLNSVNLEAIVGKSKDLVKTSAGLAGDALKNIYDNLTDAVTIRRAGSTALMTAGLYTALMTPFVPDSLIDKVSRKGSWLNSAAKSLTGNNLFASWDNATANVKVSWTIDYNGFDPDLVTTNLYLQDNNGGWNFVGNTSELFFHYSNLLPEHTYNFKARAFFEGMESRDSAIVTYCVGFLDLVNDFYPPTLAINDPMWDGRDWEPGDKKVTFNYYLDDMSHVELRVTGDIRRPRVINEGVGSQEETFELLNPYGKNVLVFLAEDAQHNITMKNVTVGADDEIPPVIDYQNIELLRSGSGGLTFFVPYSGELQGVDLMVFNDAGEKIGAGYSSNGFFDVPVRLRDVDGGGEKVFTIELIDQDGNMSILEKILKVNEDFTILADGEEDDSTRWSNQDYVWRNSWNKTEGYSSTMFSLHGLAPGQNRAFVIPLPSDGYYDLTKTTEQRFALFPTNPDIEVVFSYQAVDGTWYEKKIKPEDLNPGEWNFFEIPNNEFAVYGSDQTPDQIKRISLNFYNRGGYTFYDEESVSLDEMIGFKPVPVAGFSGYASDYDVQADWAEGDAGEPAVLNSDGTALFAADLSGGTYRSKYLHEFSGNEINDISTVDRLVFNGRFNIEGADDAVLQIYLRNNEYTWLISEYGIPAGSGELNIPVSQSDFTIDSGSSTKLSDLLKIQVGMRRVSGTYPDAVDFTTDGMLKVLDNYHFTVVK